MDCFFAQVEMRDNPELKGKAVAVGGSPNSRSVVAACSYEARKFGIHSAMPMKQAIKKYPDLKCLPVRIDRYIQVSKLINLIFKQYTTLIEPLSLDEAFLDVSDCLLFNGDAALIAADIRNKIFITLDLTASAGIAPNKFLAKIASDWNKPNGQFEILPKDIEGFIKTLSVNKIPGVGKVTAKKMFDLNIKNGYDLQKLSLLDLERNFGKFGITLYNLSRGQDDRVVSKNLDNKKSLSVEHTFSEDLTIDQLLAKVPEIYQELKYRYTKNNLNYEPKVIFVKLKFADFTTTTTQQTLIKVNNINIYRELVFKAWYRKKLLVRLLGLGVRFTNSDKNQLELDLN